MLNPHYPYKICDPVHGFIRFDALEKELIDSLFFQRLRYLHQMGVAYLVYPGATHTRFEHSLGVMELASRLYDAMMAPYHLDSSLPTPKSAEEILYWRRILRLAALCHDMGHLPFSHTAEKALLPQGGHEKKTLECIQSQALQAIWEKVGPEAEKDIIKLAVSEKELSLLGIREKLSPWEKVLSQVITEDNFGADRIDYLIRDAYYTGVGYGHFDYHQLIDSVRILPDKGSISIGIAEDGLQSVESLWIARYLMYARVYHHPKARIFTHHMSRFMVRHYAKVGFPQTLLEYIQETDFIILAALSQEAAKGDPDAQVLLKQREPFKEISLDPVGVKKVIERIDQLQTLFGEEICVDHLPPKDEVEQLRFFSVSRKDGQIVSSIEVSQFLRDIPIGGKPLRLYALPNRAFEVSNELSLN